MSLIKLFFTISKVLLHAYLLVKMKIMTNSNRSGQKRLSKNSIFKIEDNDVAKHSKSLFYRLKKQISKFFR